GICRPTAFGEITEAVWDRMVDVNTKSMAGLIDAAARHWRQAGPSAGRAVVCTASPSGAEPHEPLGIYSVTKAAVQGIAQVAAAELAQLGVRVNALAPTGRTRMVAAAMAGSPIDVDQIMPQDPDYDLYKPDHLARLVLYLVSPLCPFTGRMFGARADDIFVYGSWNAAHHVSNRGAAWTTQDLAAAMEAIPLQEDKRLVTPMGAMEVKSPGDQVLAQLQAIR
ncbi:MAG: SDR family oxidoreductase, partial [Novosphingobium sp.]|nr:SDR family oxidoreductase [Novosphingobium sp.]